MGNFQHLAEKVLAKNIRVSKNVSSFHPLAKETGNFHRVKGNITGNSNDNDGYESKSSIRICVATGKETARKPEPILKENFLPENKPKSFLSGNNTITILNNFFDSAEKGGIQFLPDDKRWIKAICYGVQLNYLKNILENYINCWIVTMNQESISYKKQNAGRFAANSFLRMILVRRKNG